LNIIRCTPGFVPLVMVAVALTVAMPDRLVAFAGLVMQIFTVYLPEDGLLEAHPSVAAFTGKGVFKLLRLRASMMIKMERICNFFISAFLLLNPKIEGMFDKAKIKIKTTGR
jgi:hypothetical protein